MGVFHIKKLSTLTIGGVDVIKALSIWYTEISRAILTLLTDEMRKITFEYVSQGE